jgi:hypothetical protein
MIRHRRGSRASATPLPWFQVKIHEGPLMSAQDIVPYAQIGTAFIATAALAVATWSLLTQKAVARRRAAIDFFLKTGNG